MFCKVSDRALSLSARFSIRPPFCPLTFLSAHFSVRSLFCPLTFLNLRSLVFETCIDVSRPFFNWSNHYVSSFYLSVCRLLYLEPTVIEMRRSYSMNIETFKFVHPFCLLSSLSACKLPYLQPLAIDVCSVRLVTVP